MIHIYIERVLSIKQCITFQLKSEFISAGLVSRAHFAMDGELQGEFSPTMAAEMVNAGHLHILPMVLN